ncbi:hypothetical protein KFE96_05695 [Kordiimonas sp. SCSIO 12603]|uniref:DUF6680 family protein n=1 Tax=Kordiimonas sp. SCSIO 12603 TaxID=2829596 RepID=UPI002103347D|nr:DUF6680 family protein [Kordiimonas sp. SCSIO 12603]UTW59796.1 hypothetical protein KFE96_05695 [Kordiimonas sp. SCSIO 12603]
MGINDYLMILAVLLAPVVAVQVDKFLERRRREKARKLDVFKTLMATRGKGLDPRHVEALNMIDMEFHAENKVLEAWKAYFDILHQAPEVPKANGGDEKELAQQQSLYDSRMLVWTNDRERLLAELLFEMSSTLGYKFDKTYIKRSIYSPQGHIDAEQEQQLLRRTLTDLILGKRHLPVLSISLPATAEEQKRSNEEATEQKLIRQLLIQHYNGELSIPVKIVGDDVPQPEPVQSTVSDQSVNSEESEN